MVIQNIDGTLIPTADLTKIIWNGFILVISAVEISALSIFCALKFLLIQVYLRSGTLIGLLLWLYGFLIPFVTWLAPRARAGKMNQILRCDWPPSAQDGAILPARDYPPCPARKIFPKSHMINPLLTKFVLSRRLDIDLELFLRVYGPRLYLGL